MAVRYDDVLGPLREAYDARAAWRDGLGKEPYSAYFQEEGFAVVYGGTESAEGPIDDDEHVPPLIRLRRVPGVCILRDVRADHGGTAIILKAIHAVASSARFA